MLKKKSNNQKKCVRAKWDLRSHVCLLYSLPFSLVSLSIHQIQRSVGLAPGIMGRQTNPPIWQWNGKQMCTLHQCQGVECLCVFICVGVEVGGCLCESEHLAFEIFSGVRDSAFSFVNRFYF